MKPHVRSRVFEVEADSGNDPIYIRNINVILTVVDGILEYNPQVTAFIEYEYQAR